MKQEIYPHSSTAPRSLRQFLATFVVAVVLPCLLLGLTIAWLLGQRIIEDRKQDASRLAAVAAQSMVNHLGTMTASLAVLSQLPLDEEHFPSFYALAQTFAQRVGYHVSLADPEGHQFLSTRLPLGAELPRRAELGSVKKAVQTGQPAVSDLFPGKMAKSFVVTVDAPVATPAGMRIITLSSDASAIAEVLYRTQMPPGWMIGLIDGQGRFIASGRDPEKWTGQPAAPVVWEASQKADSGLVHNTSVDGFRIHSFFHRIPGTDWRILIGIPDSVLYPSLYSPLGSLIGAIAAVMALTSLLAFALTRRLDAAAKQLMVVAHGALGARTTPSGQNPIAEFEDVSQVIRRVAAKLHSTFEQAAVGMAHVTLDGRIRRVNQKMCDIVGYDRDSLMGMAFQDITHPDDRAHNLAVGDQIRSGELPQASFEKRYVRPDGSVVWAQVTLSLARSPGGQGDYVIAVIEDIERRKATEQALEEERGILRSLSELASDYFWETDTESIFTSISQPKTPNSLNFQDFIGKKPWEQPVLGVSDDAWTQYRATLAARRPVRDFEIGVLRDGTEHWFTISGDPVFAHTGEFKGYRGVAHDITEQKNRQQWLEKQVAERTAELVAANKELEGFVYAASHDLRAPLGRINSFSALLESHCREQLAGDNLMFLNLIRRNTIRLIALVNDLQDHAQLVQKIQELQSVGIKALAERLIEERQHDIRDRGAQLRLAVPEQAVVRANAHGLDRVLYKLLENALKYSQPVDSPSIEIGARACGERWQVWVKDNGIGFDMQYHDRIFEIFRRLHTYEEFPGSGVGLALVKKAVDHMGGRIWAESAPGKGATFFVELPAAVEDTAGFAEVAG